MGNRVDRSRDGGYVPRPRNEWLGRGTGWFDTKGDAMGNRLDALKDKWARISRLGQTLALLQWDMETCMPPGGVRGRTEQMGLIAGVVHRWLTEPETGALIEGAEDETSGHPYDSDEAGMVRAARRAYDQKVKIPESLVERLTRATARANGIWIRAREESDFAAFAPVLAEIVDMNREMARCLGGGERPYDALLDIYEPGLATETVDGLFGELRKRLIPLSERLGAARFETPRYLTGKTFDTARQEEFGLMVLRDMGYDFNRGRQDRSAHPFTTSFGPWDVRITTRFSEDDPLSALFSSIHEGGHALYEQGLPLEHADTPLCEAVSLGVHESQSRLWENIVGRSRGFWEHYLPEFARLFPDALGEADIDSFHRAVNAVRPGLIRVEADEVTYNLHVFVRYELEKELIEGSLSTADIPRAWNELYARYLGITPARDDVGCLQDIHWAHGAFGYFPTYTIGNLLSAQLYAAARNDLPDLEGDIASGTFSALLAWLRDKVHRHGTRYTPGELALHAAGAPISAGPFMDYLEKKYGELFGV